MFNSSLCFQYWVKIKTLQSIKSPRPSPMTRLLAATLKKLASSPSNRWKRERESVKARTKAKPILYKNVSPFIFLIPLEEKTKQYTEDQEQAASQSPSKVSVAKHKITAGTSKPVNPGGFKSGRWTKDEHFRFLEALKLFGKEWKKV